MDTAQGARWPRADGKVCSAAGDLEGSVRSHKPHRASLPVHAPAGLIQEDIEGRCPLSRTVRRHCWWKEARDSDPAEAVLFSA